MVSLEVIVGQAVAFRTENPDPGTTQYGWDEGTTARRLDTLRCLYVLSHDERLVAEMIAAANVLLGPRYYGPPNFPVHNHGVIANIALIKAAQQLGISEWRDTAVARIQAETPLVFSDKGTSWEQASMYQAVNVVLWNAAADAVGPGPVADAIHANTDRAAVVYCWMTEPDGKIVQIGDSDKIAGDTVGPGRTGKAFRDDRAGWVIGRWRWTNPGTTYYSVRYGPPRRAHGQQDRGGVTWTTFGVRILVGPGRFTYDTSSPWNAYMRSPESHNVAIPAGLTLKASASVLMSGSTIGADSHVWRLSDSLYGRSHSRTVVVNDVTRTLRVSDSFSGTDLYRQQWHLDPAWRLRLRNVEGTWLRFTNSLGRTLTITTTGRFSSLVMGLASPVAGWNFPSPGSKVPNYQLTLRAYAPMTTTFVVT